MSKKRCTKCKIEKDLAGFHKRGPWLQSWCKVCLNAQNQKNALLNREKRALQSKERYQKNKVQISARHKESHARRYKFDLGFRLACNLRRRLRQILARDKSVSAVRHLGCTLPELRAHIEGQFSAGMNWDNYGKWELDHKKPLSKFDLKVRDEALAASHYSNLQPLWKADNRKKYNKEELSNVS